MSTVSLTLVLRICFLMFLSGILIKDIAHQRKQWRMYVPNLRFTYKIPWNLSRGSELRILKHPSLLEKKLRDLSLIVHLKMKGRKLRLLTRRNGGYELHGWEMSILPSNGVSRFGRWQQFDLQGRNICITHCCQHFL